MPTSHRAHRPIICAPRWPRCGRAWTRYNGACATEQALTLSAGFYVAPPAKTRHRDLLVGRQIKRMQAPGI